MTDMKKSTSSTSKNGKSDENVVVKTAHTIRDKVHGFTDEVKEKAHNLTHSDDGKKGKNDKKKDSKLPKSSKPSKIGDKDSNSSSGGEDDEDDPSKIPPPPPSSSSKSMYRIESRLFL